MQLGLDVLDGDPVLERNLNGAVVTVTAMSQTWGSGISGDDLWSMKILVCEDDGCSSVSFLNILMMISGSTVSVLVHVLDS